MGEKFQVSSELAFGFPEALGKALDFAQVWGIEGEDAVRLPQLGLLDDDGFGLIVSWCGHYNCFTHPNSQICYSFLTFLAIVFFIFS